MGRGAARVVAGTMLLAFGASVAAAEPAPSPAPVAASAPAPASAAEVVATVNGVGITRADFTRTWEYLLQRRGFPAGHTGSGEALDGLRREVLDGLVDEELLHQDAQSRGLTVPPAAVDAGLREAREQFATPESFAEALAAGGLTEEGLRTLLARNQSIEALVERELTRGVAVSDAEVREFYGGNREKFALPEEVHARHILVKVDPGADDAARQAAQAKAEGLLAQLKSGANFAELARKSSDCPTAPDGGDLGFLQNGQTVPEFDRAAFALKPGELSGVVATEYGFHIITIEARKAAGAIPEEQAAPRIREFLLAQKKGAAVAQRVQELRAGARIEVLPAFER